MVETLQRSIPADQPSCVIERPACGSQIASLEFLETTALSIDRWMRWQVQGRIRRVKPCVSFACLWCALLCSMVPIETGATR